MAHELEKISPTALLIAHFRSFTDIPFARAVAEATHAEDASLRLLESSPVDLLAVTRENAPQAEARYKSITSAIHRSGARQVMELGCGISFRGLAGGSWLRFVATDLPAIVRICHGLLESVPELSVHKAAPGMRIETLDALDGEAMGAVARHFDAEPLAIVNEGLLGYFSMDEKAAVATGVRRLLERFGGVWVTPDLPTRDQVMRAERTATRQAHESIARTTTRSFSDNAFASEAELEAFFGALGFVVETRPQLDGSFGLSCLAPLGLPADHPASFESDLEQRVLRLR